MPRKLPGKLREATRLIGEVLPDAWQLGRSRSLLGSALHQLDENAEAEKNLIAGYQILKSNQPELPAAQAKELMKQAVARLISYYQAEENQAAAVKWKQVLDESEEDPSPGRN